MSYTVKSNAWKPMRDGIVDTTVSELDAVEVDGSVRECLMEIIG